MESHFSDRTLIEHELSATTTAITRLQAELRRLETLAASGAQGASPHARAQLLARLAECVRARDERFVALAAFPVGAHSEP